MSTHHLILTSVGAVLVQLPFRQPYCGTPWVQHLTFLGGTISHAAFTLIVFFQVLPLFPFPLFEILLLFCEYVCVYVWTRVPSRPWRDGEAGLPLHLAEARSLLFPLLYFYPK